MSIVGNDRCTFREQYIAFVQDVIAHTHSVAVRLLRRIFFWCGQYGLCDW